MDLREQTMEYRKLKTINDYIRKSVNPAKSPDTLFEMYSVPIFETGHPEYLLGREIASNKTVVQKNDILLCKINPRINRVWIVADESENPNIASSEWIVVRSSKYNPEFLAWYFRSPRFKNLMTSEVTGIGGSLTRAQPKSVAEYPVPVLEKPEQDAIAIIFNTVDTIIKKRRKQLQKLDELVKTRFVEMFGDVIRNSKSWEIRVLADIASSRLGKMLDTKQQTGECSYPYLANFNVQWFRFNTENLNQMDFNEEDRIEFELQNGDLLVCEGGEIGRCAVWHNEIQPCFFQKALHRVRCNRQIVHPDYLGWWFKYNCDHDGFAAIAGAKATIAHLPGVKLKQLRVAIPPLELQEQFAAFIEQTDKSKVAVQKALDEAQLLFDSLMQKYFG